MDKLFELFVLFSAVYASAMADYGTIEEFTIPENTTSLNISVCTGRNNNWIKAVYQRASWHQAMAICRELGFLSVDTAIPSWPRRMQLRRYLEDSGDVNETISYWTGLFRPYRHVIKWYYFTHTCKESSSVLVNNFDDGQCLLLRRNESVENSEVVTAANCGERHSFACIKYTGSLTYLSYYGFDISDPENSSPLPLINVSMEECKYECFKNDKCNAYTYDHDRENCTIARMIYGTSYEMYTISPSAENVTHYAKFGCVREFSRSNVSADPNATFIIPDCGVDEIPAGFCPYDVDTDVTAGEQDLTVDPTQTSAYQRKLISAYDGRTIPKTFGALASIVIIVFLMSAFIFDCFIPSAKVKKKGK